MFHKKSIYSFSHLLTPRQLSGNRLNKNNLHTQATEKFYHPKSLSKIHNPTTNSIIVFESNLPIFP